MSVEDRVLRLEGFAADVREHTRLLTELIRRHDERLDEHAEQMSELRSAHVETERAIAALADAQIRTEEAQTKTEAALTALAQAQAHTDQRLDALIDIVRGGRGGQA